MQVRLFIDIATNPADPWEHNVGIDFEVNGVRTPQINYHVYGSYADVERQAQEHANSSVLEWAAELGMYPVLDDPRTHDWVQDPMTQW